MKIVCFACFIMIIKELLIGMKEKKNLLIYQVDTKKDGSYDVLIPGSGGKDSIFVVSILEEK